MKNRLSKFYNIATTLLLLSSLGVIAASHFGFFSLGAKQTQVFGSLKVLQSALMQFNAEYERFPLTQEVTSVETLESAMSPYLQGEFFLQSAFHFVSYESDGRTFFLNLEKDGFLWTVTPERIESRKNQ